MFAVPGLLALIFVDYLRPQEYIGTLAALPLLHIATAFAVLGFILDLRLGVSRPEPAPQLVLVGMFYVWCLATVALRAHDELVGRAWSLLIPIAIYVLVAHGIQNFRMLQVVCGLLLGICVILATLGVIQGFAPYGCHRVIPRGGQSVYVYDGRPCEDGARSTCEEEGAEPGFDYVCEKVGLFGTQSDHGRVRYRGTLQDPNELSLALGIAIPFAFAFFDRRRTLMRLLLLVFTCALVGLCAYFTQSRGGQFVFFAVLAIYLIRRYGVRRGIMTGIAIALPLLALGALGGRAGGESSTIERTECWWVGLHLAYASPLFGVGSGQFTEHHYLTAHNSYILAAAELGLPGMLLWTSIVWVSLKIPLQAVRARLVPVGSSWSLALAASMVGLLVGILFLSFTYKDVLWIYVGLTGALYQAIRRHDPSFTVTFGARDFGLVALFDVSLLVALTAYTGIKLGW